MMLAGPEDSFNGLLAQLVRAPGSYPDCPGFKSQRAHFKTEVNMEKRENFIQLSIAGVVQTIIILSFAKWLFS